MLTGPQKSSATADTASESSMFAHNLQEVHERIVAAALRFRRSPASVTLLAVSKQQSADTVRELADAGQRDFGENYLQEALPKIATLRDRKITWHYIGQIQSNKTRPIAECFSWVHTVDRLKIAERLNEQRSVGLEPLNVCLQVKLGDEPGKGGTAPLGIFELAQRIATLPRLRLRGLMCIPPPTELFDEQLAYFNACTALLLDIQARGIPLDTLSMGMSSDLEAAVAAGATIVRVGTAIFGERNKAI
jgi:pyridoxal phosphate enzyme (YggS family)